MREFRACIEDFNMREICLTAVAVICIILFDVGFDLESMSMCMYSYLLYIISKYWVRLRYLSGLESSYGSGLHSYFSFGYIGNL